MEKRYKQIREIGRGAMGVVYLGHDTIIDRKLAIKELIIPPDIGQRDRDELVERFYREARAAGGLSHPNIVTIHDVFEEDERYFIAMEFINGSKLSDILRSGPMSMELATNVMIQCLNAVSYAHANGIVHRDLKPDNIFLTPDKRVKVTDFGIASITGARRITTEGMLIGTPGYMSPEQVRGYNVEESTDIFSLGIVFYELLTTRNPFDAESSTAVMDRIVNDDPLPVTRLNSSVPETVGKIIEKSLHKLPEKRFQTAEDFKLSVVTNRISTDERGEQGISSHTISMVKTPLADMPRSGDTTCPCCGQVVNSEWFRCPWCATNLGGTTEPPLPSHPAAVPMLTVVEGYTAGTVFAIEKNIVYIGRGLDSDIQVEDALISRRHARIFKATDGNFYIEDEGSSNGTFVNDKLVTTARINSGDYIGIGETTLVFIGE